MLSLALLLIVFYSLHLFLKWLLSNNRGKWVAITLFILHRIMYLMIYVFNWVIIVNAILNRTELLIALVFTLPMAWYMGKVCLHDINMPQRRNGIPSLADISSSLNGRLFNGNTRIKMSLLFIKYIEL